MATKTAKNKKTTSTLDMLKNKAGSLNEVALKTTHEVVDETLVTGEQWQNLFAKTLKKGTVLFGRQQDLVITGLEQVKEQFSTSNMRFRKLLSFKPVEKKIPKKTVKKSKPVVKAKKSVDELMEAMLDTDKAVKKAVKPTTVKKAVAKTAKKPAAKKVDKPAALPKTGTVTKLTIIEGIGPKIQELLNNAGIINFEQLAAATPDQLKDILVAAGSRFQLHDPSTWAAQAKLAAAGKMEELKVLQAELKGGK